jgi:exodeoxyribonuclease VII large subunit
LLAAQLSRIDNIIRLLDSYNPFNNLKKGYALIRNENGKIISNIHNLSINQKIALRLKNGSAKANILENLSMSNPISKNPG